MDLEDVRIKEVADLSEEEKGFLKEHTEELTDDKKVIFKDIITEEKEEKKEEEFKFESKEDFDKAVAERTEEVIAAKEEERKKEEEKAKGDKGEEDERFFPDGYQAKDWNEAAKEMFPKFRERIFKEQNEVRQKTQETLDNINKEFDAEIETELTQIGVEYQGVTSMTQAYKIWKALNTGEKKTEEVSSKQRDLAGKVGRTGGEGEPAKQRSYKEMSGRSMDEMIEEDLESMGVKT